MQRSVAILALLVLAAFAGAMIMLRQTSTTPDPQLIAVADYGLTVADVNAAKPETLNLLREERL